MSSLLSRLHETAAPYLRDGWRYGRTNRVAYVWPRNVRGPAVATIAADKAVDCSTMTASILMRLYPAAPWKQQDYQDLQVWDAAVPDSPIRAVERVGVGVRAEGFAAEYLHLVQGWRVLPGTPGKKADGHAIIVYDRGNGKLDVLESTSKEGGMGPRWRDAHDAALHLEFGAALYIARLL